MDACHRGDGGIGSRELAAYQSVAIRAGQHTESAAELVDAVPAELALVEIVQLLATAAALARRRDPGFERLELFGLTGCERSGGRIDEAEDLAAQLDDGGSGPVESRGYAVPYLGGLLAHGFVEGQYWMRNASGESVRQGVFYTSPYAPANNYYQARDHYLYGLDTPPGKWTYVSVSLGFRLQYKL